jgi:hypothetical protein
VRGAHSDLSDAEREAIRAHVAAAPPLSEAQISRIRLLLHGVEGGR